MTKIDFCEHCYEDPFDCTCGDGYDFQCERCGKDIATCDCKDEVVWVDAVKT